MTRTARRRWSREFKGEIDGMYLGGDGPVFLHGYDPPAGGKWIDNVIPGKLGAFDRNSGETLWISPCEVGYGRGFGSGLDGEGALVLLGPSIKGHRIVRMSPDSGELLGASEIEAFDRAVVGGDMCVTVTPGRVAGIMTAAMVEVWAYSADGERYHLVARDGDYAFVVYTDVNRKRQGVRRLELESGDNAGTFLEPEYAVIHDLAAGDGVMVVLSGTPRGGNAEALRLEAFSTHSSDPLPLWRHALTADAPGDGPDATIVLDSGKVYIARGAVMQVLDALSGRELGEMTLPGLDEHIAWQVRDGAGVLAEETRASLFELPA